MKRLSRLTAVVALILPAGAAVAGDVYVAGQTAVHCHANSNITTPVFPALCSSINSMTTAGTTIFVGDAFGTVWIFDAGDPQNVQSVWVGGDNTAMAYWNGQLITGASDRTVRRLDVASGQVVGSFQAQSPIVAMTVSGNTLYFAGNNTLIYRGDAGGSSFNFLTGCFAIVQSLAVMGDHLYVGGASGTVMRFHRTSGAFLNQFQHPSPTAMAVDGYALWIGSGGTLSRVNPATGATVFSTSTGISTRAVAVVGGQCAPDFDENGTLNVDDFSAYINAFAARQQRADVDVNGHANVDDFMTFINAFAQGCAF